MAIHVSGRRKGCSVSTVRNVVSYVYIVTYLSLPVSLSYFGNHFYFRGPMSPHRCHFQSNQLSTHRNTERSAP